MANFIFKKDKLNLVYEYNLSTVKNISNDLQNLLENVDDKLQLLAWSSYQRSNISKKDLFELMSREKNLIAVFTSDNFKNLKKLEYSNEKHLKLYGYSGNRFKKSHNDFVPYEKILQNGHYIWNATLNNGPPSIGLGRTVVLKSEKGIPYKQFAVIAFIRSDQHMQNVKSQEHTNIQILNKDGESLLTKPDLESFNETKIKNELFLKALKSPISSSVLKFKPGNERLLAAFSKSYGKNVYVLAHVSENRAFSVVKQFIQRSILFAMIVLTATFIAAIYFSRSLVRPLQTLTHGMAEVSQGDLSTRIKIKTNDEIQSLAQSFNIMIEDLQKSRLKLIEMNETLENKVKERTQQLESQNQAVKQAQEALIRTTRLAAVGEIAGQAAHEVLNPLTSIISRLHRINERQVDKSKEELTLLEEISEAWKKDVSDGGLEKLIENWNEKSSVHPDKSLWEEDIQNIDDIKANIKSHINNLQTDTQFLLKESQRINKIIQSMRAMNVVHAEKTKVSLHQLITEGVNVMADLADKLNIEVNQFLHAESDQVFLDPDEFIQAFTNLLRNAIQAVYEKSKSSEVFEPSILITTMNNGQEIEVHIQDNGIGIESENQNKLFENQFTTKSKDEGTGLGLSISRRFIRAFGGDIYLENSMLGEGSTFVIKLPLNKEKLGETA